MSNISLNYAQIIDPASFKSINLAKIYIGEYSTLPNPANAATWKQAYFVNSDGTRTAASQPIRTNAAGFAVDGSGNIKTIQVDGGYSLLVQDQYGATKFSQACSASNSGAVLEFDTIAGFTGALDGSVCYFKGRDTVGDGGGGLFWYSASSTQPTDGGTVFKPAAGGGRIFRQGWTVSGFNEELNIKWFGAKGDGVTYDNAAISAAIESQQNLIFPPGTYKLNAAISAAVGSNKKLRFMPGSRFISDNLNDGIMYFHGTADGFSMLGNPELGYSTTPVTRLAHTIYIRGKRITNLLIDGPRILNGANMAVAVFCGNDNEIAAGSKNITICNIRSSNTLGDTVHVEGADSDVNIYNIDADNSGDDVVAVVNYTGTGPAPRHPTQTNRVRIHNVNSRDAVTSSISLGGVNDFIVDLVTEGAKAGSSCFTLKLVHDASYAVGNSNGLIDNVVSDNALKVLALDTPAGGTAFNSNIRVGKLNATNVRDSVFFTSNSDPASSGRLSDIHIEKIVATLQPGARPWYASNVAKLHIGDAVVYGGTVDALVGGCSEFWWDNIEFKNPSASSDYVLTIVTSSISKAGNLTIDAQRRPHGLRYQSNAKTVHNGIWSVSGASASNYVFGSNANVSGYFGESSGSQYIGAAVSAGTTSDVIFSSPPVGASDGATVRHIVSVASNEGGRWGYKNATATQLTMVWPDNLSYVFVNYSVRYSAT